MKRTAAEYIELSKPKGNNPNNAVPSRLKVSSEDAAGKKKKKKNDDEATVGRRPFADPQSKQQTVIVGSNPSCSEVFS
jgi:hypothetical protein